MGIKQKGIDLAVDLSYRRGARQMENLTGVSVSRTRLNSWVKGTEIELDLSLEDWPKLIYVDGTGYHRQDGTQGQVKLVLVKGFSGKVDGVKLYVDRSWEEIGREINSHLGEERMKSCVLLSDGEEAIERNLLVEGMEHQRCQWHGWRDLGYMLWADGMSKEEREIIVNQLRKLTIALPFEETIAEEDKEGIREEAKGSKGFPGGNGTPSSLQGLSQGIWVSQASWREALHLCGTMAGEGCSSEQDGGHHGAHHARDSQKGKAHWCQLGRCRSPGHTQVRAQALTSTRRVIKDTGTDSIIREPVPQLSPHPRP